MPAWVGFGHLTLLEFVSQIMVGASCALSRYNREWLL